MIKWWRQWRKQRRCLHHEIGGNPANTTPAFSYIDQSLLDVGRRKMLWCTECERTWIV